MTKNTIACQINGVGRTLEVEASTLLVNLVRDLGLTGTKVSCDLEVCGVCTVLLDGLPVSACTTLAVEANGKSVETIEGLARNGELHPVQEAFLDHFAFQCGFCTPGMIMSAKALLETTPSPTRDEVTHWMDGNICRCTGYESIVDAVMGAAEKPGRAS